MRLAAALLLLSAAPSVAAEHANPAIERYVSCLVNTVKAGLEVNLADDVFQVGIAGACMDEERFLVSEAVKDGVKHGQSASAAATDAQKAALAARAEFLAEFRKHRETGGSSR